MRVKTILLTLLFVLAMTMASCSSPEGEKDDWIPFIGGNNGLKPHAIDGSPPPTVTDGGSSNFGITVALENVGESDVGPGTENPFVQVRIAGINPDNWNTTQEALIKRVENRVTSARKNFDGTILPGEVSTLSFQPLNFQHKVRESEIFTFRAEVCYDYSTHSTVRVCIKDDIVEHLQDDTLCRLRDDLEPKNSGAPIHVVEADQNPVGNDKIQVNFVVQNVNNGVFFNRADDSPLGACDFDVRNRGIYKALLVVHPVDRNNYDLNCRGFENSQKGFEDVDIPSGAAFDVVSMNPNAPKSFTCFLEQEEGTRLEGRIFQDLMNFDIYYRYGRFLDIPVLVQNSGTADLTKTPADVRGSGDMVGAKG